MVESSIFWLRVAACLYALGLLHSLLVVVRHRQNIFRLAMGAFKIAVVLHGVSIVDLAIAANHLPVANYQQSLSLCAFLIALVFLASEWRYRVSGMAVALFPLIFLMTVVGTTDQPAAAWPASGIRGAWLAVHIVLVLAGYASLAMTAVAAIAYLVQERRLKTKQASALLERLPPLATLDNIISGSLGFGFVLITLGLVFGIMWAYIEGSRWVGDARITLSLFTWGLLLVTMFLRASAGWRGRKAAVMALTVLGCSAATWVAHAKIGSTLLP